MADRWAIVSGQMRRWAREECGGIAITYALSMSMLAGFAGLGIEVGDWYVTRNIMKNAADAASLAVAVAGENIADENSLRAAAFQAARNAGFDGGLDALVIRRPRPELVEHLPAAIPAGATESLQDKVRLQGWEVEITQQKDLVLAGMVGGGPAVTLRVVSVAGAGLAGEPQPRCIVGLETTDGVAAVRSNGAAFSLADGCGIHANSDLIVNGNNQSVADRPISVTGDFTGTISPTQLQTHARTHPDPFAGNASLSGFDPDLYACTHNNQRPNSPTTYDATGRADRMFVFCGNTDFRANTTFVGPAIYVFKDSFDISNAVVTGTDVTFILADMNPDAVAVTGNGTLRLTAPRRAVVAALPEAARTIMTPWIGIALFGDEDSFAGGTAFSLSEASFAGTFTMRVDGAIYMPGAGLDLRGNVSGNSGVCMRLVARQVELSGSVSLGSADCNDQFGGALNDLLMVTPKIYF